MKTRIRIIVLVAVLAIATVGVLKSGLFRKEETGTIRLSGNMELTEVDISFKSPGRLVALHAKEGSMVQRGMVLAQIEHESLSRQRDREQAGLVSAQAQMVQLMTSIEYQKRTIEDDIALRQADLRAAEAHLAELLAGSRPQEIQSAQAQVAEAKSVSEQASRDWERAQTLYKNEDISTAQYDQYRARYETTAQTLRQAEEHLGLVKEGPRKEQIDAARAQVERAKAAIRLSEAQRIDLKRREQEVDVRRADIERARASIAVIDTQLNDATVASPIDGVVLVKSAEPGETLAAGSTVLTIGDLEHPWLRGYIPEKDLGRVKLGASVKLTTDSYPGKTYAGRVTFIASEAEFTPKQIQTPDERVKLVYRIKIEADNPDQELKSNMPVDAEIEL